MYTHKSLKLFIVALFLAALVIFSGCAGTAPPINHPPTIVSLTANPQSPIEVNQSTIIICLATDQDEDILTYNWTKTGGTITGSGSTITWTAPALPGTYTITCTVSDGELIDIQGISIVVTEPEPENQPPIITSTAVTSATVGEAYIYDVEAADSEGDTLTYTISVIYGPPPTGMTINPITGLISWIPTTTGYYNVTVEVSDDGSPVKSTTQSFTIIVTEPEPINHPPVISSLSADPSSININQSSTITCIATDQDGDILTYNWSKTGGTITGSGFTITWTAPATAGTYTITCTVSDSNGGQDSESVSIIVNDLGSVPSVSAIAITYHLFRGKEQSIINKLVKEDKIHRSNPTIIRSAEVDKSGITYAIYVEWAKFNGASGYRVYRSVNWTAFQLVYTEEASYDYEWYGFWEDDIQIGNIYSYYAIAYGPFGETTPDKIVSVDTWLPGCSLINPVDMATITNPNPTFTWSPVGASTFPYGAIYSAESDLWVYETGGETSWWILFDGLLTNTAIYNQDGEAIPLVYGHNYVWDSWGYGYDQNGNLIAISASEDWEFYFSEGIVYRALCVGVGDYLYFPDACGNIDLPAPPYDVDRMRQTLGYCKFGLSNTGFSTIPYLKDAQATKANILQKIAFTFSGADSNDISYFYFSGHGMRYENTSYLCPTDVSCYSPLDAYISVDELEQALSAIPGTKVVLLDSCHSGGFIGKGKEEENKILKEELIDFNKDVIDIFSLSESKSLLTTNKYKVLTSCHYYQVCYEIVPVEGDPFGVFTTALCDGCGYYGSYPADTNLDTKVSLQEAYLYIIDWVYSLGVDQDVQVYPSNSNFTIVEY